MAFMSDGIRYLPVQLGLVVLFLALMFVPRLRGAAIISVVCVALSNVTTDVLKHTWPGQRPPAELLDAVVRVEGGMGIGTASAHSANMMAVAVCFLAVDRRWGAAWLAVALLAGVSRVYGGVHYPSQVLLGWGIGAAYGLLVTWLVQKWWPWRERPQPEPSGPSDPECPEPDLQP